MAELQRRYRDHWRAVGLERETLEKRLEEVRHEEAEIDQQIRLLLHQREVLKVRREAILRDQDEVFQHVLERECLEISKQLLREFTSTFSTAALPREIRDMVYKELIPKTSTFDAHPATGLHSNWTPPELRSQRFDLWTVDVMGKQFIYEYAETFYNTREFHFWDSAIKRLPLFLETDRFNMGLLPRDLVRRIKLVVRCKYAYRELIGGHIHDGVETVSESWEAIEDILPQLSGLVNKLCHITLTIRGPVLAKELYQWPIFWRIQLLPGLKMLAPVLWGLWMLGHPIKVLFGHEEFMFQSDILYSQYQNKLIDWATAQEIRYNDLFKLHVDAGCKAEEAMVYTNANI